MHEGNYDQEVETSSIDNQELEVSDFIVIIYILALLFGVALILLVCLVIKNNKKKRLLALYIKTIGVGKKYNRDEQIHPEKCTICYDDYNKDDDILTFKCNHTYHHKCVVNLINLSEGDCKCPYCKKIIRVTTENV